MTSRTRTVLMLSFAATAVLAAPAWVWSQATLSPIAQMLEPAPDPSGGTFYFANGTGNIANYVAGSPSGKAAFVTPITGPTGVTNSNNSTVYVGTHNAHTQLARTDNAVPDMPDGWTYSFLNEPRLYGNYVTFPVQMFQKSTETTRPGYMGGTAADGVRLLWGQGSPAPTLPGVTLLNPQNPAMNSGGTAYFSARLQGSGITSGVNDSAMFTGTPGALAVYKRSGTQADALPAGVNYRFLGNPAVNESGTVAFNAIITGGGTTSSNDDVLYTGQPNNLSLVARAGVTDVPGTSAGIKYNIITPPIINNAAKFAFRASITGPGVSFGNEAGIWAGTPGQLKLIMRDGSPAPGTSTNFREPTEFYLADTGKMVMHVGLADSGRGIWTGDEDGLELLARVGDDAPDTAWNFTSLNNIAISRNGRIAFSGVLDAPGFQYGVWITDENGDVRKLIQTGDTVDVEGVGQRTISSLLYGGQRTNDNFVIDDTGRVFLRAQFTNGLGGIFSVAIPEPTGLAAITAALAILSRRRRRATGSGQALRRAQDGSVDWVT